MTDHPLSPPFQSILKYMEMEKESDVDDEDTSFEASKGDSYVVNEKKMAHVANVVATSTPEKITGNSYAGNIWDACQIFIVTETMPLVNKLVFLVERTGCMNCDI